MTQRAITDPEVRMLAAIAASLEPDYVSKADDWRTSPFGWIKQQQSRRKGKIFEQLVAGWCAAKGFDVTAPPNSDSDRVIGGLRAEIKGSTLWAAGGFKFQQIRDQEYDIAICLGISPFDAQCWAIPKEVLLSYPEGVTSQHGGQAGRDTAWLGFQADSPPDWLRDWGGRLSHAYAVLRELHPRLDLDLLDGAVGVVEDRAHSLCGVHGG